MEKISVLAKSMKRLYEKGRISEEQVRARVVSGVLSEEEYVYITGEAYAE